MIRIEHHCKPQPSQLSEAAILSLQPQLHPDWVINAEKQTLSRTMSFQNYYETMAFVNAIAFIAHRENHHPDLTVRYHQCDIEYTTHDAGGLSMNDFVCAYQIDGLSN